jgi:drug/metabolite transporter (DMT)-like permease
MDAWIPITIAAAFAQTLRFMVQKHLAASRLSPSGATWARFLYSAPLVAGAMAVYLSQSGQGMPDLSAAFWAYALMGGAAQILATVCTVALFSRRNFAVGITFKKTEVMLTAVAGFIILGEIVSILGALAILIGFFGVLALSDTPGNGARGIARFASPAAGLGLLSGLFFALSAVGYRGAVLALDTDDIVLKAGATLAIVTAVQTLALGLWLAARDPGQIRAVLATWRVSGLVGVFSMIGSFCWFSAFALQTAAYVFALGQIELIFSIAASVAVFGERISTRELAGMALLTASILILVLAA